MVEFEKCVKFVREHTVLVRNSECMYESESEIWGSMTQPGVVKGHIRELSEADRVERGEMRWVVRICLSIAGPEAEPAPANTRNTIVVCVPGTFLGGALVFAAPFPR